MTTPTPDDDWEMAIFVPAARAAFDAEAAAFALDPSVRTHSETPFVLPIPTGTVTRVRGAMLQDQWSKTFDTLMRLTDHLGQGTKDWRVEEIEVGLTLSAKGELAFIAEAGAEASITVKLSRKPAAI